MSAGVTDIRDFRRRTRIRALRFTADSIRVYHHLLREDDISIEEIARALQASGLTVSSDPETGADIIRRRHRPTKTGA